MILVVWKQPVTLSNKFSECLVNLKLKSMLAAG